jgi:hypothetical protein
VRKVEEKPSTSLDKEVEYTNMVLDLLGQIPRAYWKPVIQYVTWWIESQEGLSYYG